MEVNLPYAASIVYTSAKEMAGALPPGDIGTFLLGAVLTLLAIFVVFVLKRVLENLVIGVVGFLVLKFLLSVQIPTIPGLIISLLFGLAGLGVLLILHFFGVL